METLYSVIVWDFYTISVIIKQLDEKISNWRYRRYEKDILPQSYQDIFITSFSVFYKAAR